MSAVLIQIVLCILVADLITGAAHWAEETYGVPTWPFFGKAVIGPNIQHHFQPAKICEGTLVSRNWQMWLAAALAMFLAAGAGCLTWQFALVATLASFGNETHSWAHGRAPRFARVLQDMGALVSPAQHAKHHKPPFDKTFCTITSWLNPLLDAIRFWPAVEWAIARFGVHPKRMTATRGFV